MAVIVGIALFVTYSGSRLAVSWSIVETHWPYYKRTKQRSPYQELGYRAYGKPGKYVGITSGMNSK